MPVFIVNTAPYLPCSHRQLMMRTNLRQISSRCSSNSNTSSSIFSIYKTDDVKHSKISAINTAVADSLRQPPWSHLQRVVEVKVVSVGEGAKISPLRARNRNLYIYRRKHRNKYLKGAKNSLAKKPPKKSFSKR